MNPPRLIGRYEILDELGQGAMGSVFRARDPAIDRIVAVKTILAAALLSGQDEEARQRFYREARAAGALAHPGIVPIFDVGEQEGVPFLVMEYVDGQTLGQVMKRGERGSLDRVCEIGQKIAEALGYAHRNGVIHRDIKPANILMTSHKTYGEERPKITDFGIAKLASGQLTLSGQFLGTPAFMPPEQFTGEPIDGRTDLFSLGVILYWMSTGEQPFPGETMTTVSYKIVHTDPLPPAKLNPAISAGLEAVILKSLAKSPSSRYQSGEELADALAGLRKSAGATGMFTAVPVSVIPTGESQETLDSLQRFPTTTGGLLSSTLAAPPHQPVTKVSADKNRIALVLGTAGVLAILAIAGGGYLAVRKRAVASPPPEPAAAAAVISQRSPNPSLSAVSDAASIPQSAKSVAETPKSGLASGGGTPKSEIDPTTTLNAGKPAARPASKRAPRQKPSVAFDPKKLDPKTNARLKLDFSHFPADTSVSVEMDGKVFFEGSVGNKSEYDNLYAPPGVHELRITVGGSLVQKASNIVSAEFIARKHLTLKLEPRPQPKVGAKFSDLDPATQIIASLKNDRFSF